MEALPSVDLVVATIGRRDDLGRLLDSLVRQTHRPARVLVVDQGADDAVARLVEARAAHLPVVRLRSERGLSRARNAALPNVTADVVGFPDDDCTYPDDLLERVAQVFARRPDLGVLTGRTADAEGRTSSRWHPGGAVHEPAVWHAGNSASLFVRRELLERIGPFDERLGLGARTPWRSGEEIELLVRALRSGARVEHVPSIVVTHPLRTPGPDELAELGYRDGGSVGYVLGLHPLGPGVGLRMLTRPLGGALLACLRRDRALARFHANTWRGRVRGYRAGLRARARRSSNRSA